MKKLWKDIKDEVDFVKDISVEKDSCDSEGYCQVYIINGKYKCCRKNNFWRKFH